MKKNEELTLYSRVSGNKKSCHRQLPFSPKKNHNTKKPLGHTFNQHLMGPKLLPELTDILLRWRIYKFVFTADIAKMYHQIWVDSKD